jgi:hypothetical protein
MRAQRSDHGLLLCEKGRIPKNRNRRRDAILIESKEGTTCVFNSVRSLIGQQFGVDRREPLSYHRSHSLYLLKSEAQS